MEGNSGLSRRGRVGRRADCYALGIRQSPAGQAVVLRSEPASNNLAPIREALDQTADRADWSWVAVSKKFIILILFAPGARSAPTSQSVRVIRILLLESALGRHLLFKKVVVKDLHLFAKHFTRVNFSNAFHRRCASSVS